MKMFVGEFVIIVFLKKNKNVFRNIVSILYVQLKIESGT